VGEVVYWVMVVGYEVVFVVEYYLFVGFDLFFVCCLVSGFVVFIVCIVCGWDEGLFVGCFGFVVFWGGLVFFGVGVCWSLGWYFGFGGFVLFEYLVSLFGFSG